MVNTTSFVSRAFEKKFPFPSHNVEFVLDLLRHLCLPDRAYPQDDIFTVYYDTSKLDAYYEKLDGHTLRSKLRVRWYGASYAAGKDISDVFVEVKSKQGLEITKTRKRVHLAVQPARLNLTDCIWEDLLAGVSTELGWEGRLKLYPAILVKYRRWRFLDVASGAQIAVDRQIAAIAVNQQLLPAAAPAAVDTAVLEVKGGNKLPPVLRMIRGLSFQWMPFSKYAACLEACIRGGG